MNEFGEEVIEPIYSDFVGRYLTDENGFVQIGNDIYKLERDHVVQFPKELFKKFVSGNLEEKEFAKHTWNQHGSTNAIKRCSDAYDITARTGSEGIRLKLNSDNKSHGGWVDGGWYHNAFGWSFEHEIIAIAQNRVLGAWVRAIRTITLEANYSFTYLDPVAGGMVEMDIRHHDKDRAYTLSWKDGKRVTYSFSNSPDMHFTKVNSRANTPNTSWANITCN